MEAEKKLDLTKILQVGDKVYSPLFGEVEVLRIEKGGINSIRVQTECHNTHLFHANGQYFLCPDAEIMLLPSKEIRTWAGYKHSIPDKALVWAWDDSYTHIRCVGFYDAKNKNLFRLTGSRDGERFKHYELYEGEYPEWALNAQLKLEGVL